MTRITNTATPIASIGTDVARRTLYRTRLGKYVVSETLPECRAKHYTPESTWAPTLPRGRFLRGHCLTRSEARLFLAKFLPNMAGGTIGRELAAAAGAKLTSYGTVTVANY